MYNVHKVQVSLVSSLRTEMRNEIDGNVRRNEMKKEKHPVCLPGDLCICYLAGWAKSKLELEGPLQKKCEMKR